MIFIPCKFKTYDEFNGYKEITFITNQNCLSPCRLCYKHDLLYNDGWHNMSSVYLVRVLSPPPK